MIRTFWRPDVKASREEWELYQLKGSAWYAWFRLQTGITTILWRIGAPYWLCGVPAAVMFWRWSDWWHARFALTRCGRTLRILWRQKLGSRSYRLCGGRSE